MVEFLRTSNKEEGIGILMVEHNRLVTNELTNLTMTMQDDEKEELEAMAIPATPKADEPPAPDPIRGCEGRAR